MSVSGKIVTGAALLLVAIVVGVGLAIHSANSYDAAHPQTCISEQKLVNHNGSTLTFANGQVLEENQMVGNSDFKLGNDYCVAWARS